MAQTEISAKELREKLDDSLVIDVREKEELKEYSIRKAKNIPLSELNKRLDELPKDKEFFVICRSGNRSSRAVMFLRKLGFNAVNVKGGVLEYGKIKE
jgi:rhodanese-related sulfurtransferase